VLAHPRSNQVLTSQVTKKTSKTKGTRSDKYNETNDMRFHLPNVFTPPSGHNNEGAKEVKSIKCRSSPTQANAKLQEAEAKFVAKGLVNETIKSNLISTRLSLVGILPEVKSSRLPANRLLQVISWQFLRHPTPVRISSRWQSSRSSHCNCTQKRLNNSKSWLETKPKVRRRYLARLKTRGNDNPKRVADATGFFLSSLK